MARVVNGTRAFASPSRYVQGRHELDHLPEYTQIYGERVFIIIDCFFYDELSVKFEKMYQGKSSQIMMERFEGQIYAEKINQIAELARPFRPNVVVGIGGGKAMDTAKAVADELHCAEIIVPTTASTDAPASSLSVIYTPEGVHNGTRHYYKNPDLVLLDTEIIVHAPIRYLVAGMGDGLATYVEACANAASDSANYIGRGYRRTLAGMAVAKSCQETILSKGYQAKVAAEQGLCTPDVEDVIEANTLLSGLGFQNTGCAGAHALNAGFSNLSADECGKMLHGEFVAFGTLVQLMIEQHPEEEIDRFFRFFRQVGLPTTLEDLGIDRENYKALWKVAEISMKSYWAVEPFYMDAQIVFDGILATDQKGRGYRKNCSEKP